MRKLTNSFFLELSLVLICLRPIYAQTATTAPADAKAAPANETPTGQAPDEVMKKLSDLVRAGKYAEAQQTVAALLILYPDDQRLVKAKVLLDKASVTAGAPSGAPSANPPTSNVPSPQPASNLAGMDKVDYNALIELARQAQQTTDLEQQNASLKQFMTDSGLFLQKHPNEMVLWQLRVASAISLNDPMAAYEAGQKLIAAGAADSTDTNLQRLLAQLKNKGWLDKKTVEIKEQGKRLQWLSGTWNVSWDWYDFGINGRDQEAFVLSDSGVVGYVIGGDGVKSANPDFRGTILDSGEIKWECYLPPSDTGQMYVFRYISGGNWSTYKMTIGRRSDPHGYLGDAEIDTGDRQFYPSGWQPVSSYKFDKEKRTMTIVITPQEADPRSAFSKKYPVTLTFRKIDSAQNEQVQ